MLDLQFLQICGFSQIDQVKIIKRQNSNITVRISQQHTNTLFFLFRLFLVTVQFKSLPPVVL